MKAAELVGKSVSCIAVYKQSIIQGCVIDYSRHDQILLSLYHNSRSAFYKEDLDGDEDNWIRYNELKLISSLKENVIYSWGLASSAKIIYHDRDEIKNLIDKLEL